MKRLLSLLFAVILFSCAVYAYAVGQNGGPFDLVARQGMRGDEVSHVQMLLSHLGFYRGKLDSRFGPETDLAVRSFQKKLGFPEDGVVTNQLMQQLHLHAKRIAHQPPSHYVRILDMEATAYTTEDPGCGLYTYGGNRLRHGLVAVDPQIIPLGTRMFIPNYGYAIADDIGGAIKGYRIDLGYESRPEALKFGRRMVKVYILE